MNFTPAYHRSRKRLVLCGRAKDSLVEAIIQVGDDQEEEAGALPPHHVLPTMSNVVSIQSLCPEISVQIGPHVFRAVLSRSYRYFLLFNFGYVLTNTCKILY